jgi:hypothetical protein
VEEFLVYPIVFCNSPPMVIETAQYLNSGIFPTGSRAGFVIKLAAAS